MQSIMGQARAGYDGMNENVCICPSSNVLSAWALENVDLETVMSTAASIATLTWYDLEPKMVDK